MKIKIGEKEHDVPDDVHAHILDEGAGNGKKVLYRQLRGEIKQKFNGFMNDEEMDYNSAKLVDVLGSINTEFQGQLTKAKEVIKDNQTLIDQNTNNSVNLETALAKQKMEMQNGFDVQLKDIDIKQEATKFLNSVTSALVANGMAPENIEMFANDFVRKHSVLDDNGTPMIKNNVSNNTYQANGKSLSVDEVIKQVKVDRFRLFTNPKGGALDTPTGDVPKTGERKSLEDRMAEQGLI